MYRLYSSRSKIIFIIFACLLLGTMALLQTQSTRVEAAPPDVWVDYEVHERNIIQVKLVDGMAVRVENGRLSLPQSTNKTENDPTQSLPAGEWAATFEDIPVATLNNWQKTAEAEVDEDIPDLSLFFRVTLPKGIEAAEAIPEFWASPLVEVAYPVDKPIQPPLPPDYETSNPGNFNTQSNTNIYQRYLDPAANGGMDVRYAWEGTGGRGAGIDICDVEYGYNQHADLPAIILLADPSKQYTNDFYEHGTAVLGMLGAKDNGWGITGMVPEARLLFSPVTPHNGSFNIANAITRCIDNLNAGDIILIEQQAAGRDGNYVPVEWDPAVYAAIKVAVGKKIVVVEAAGNGDEDLDHNFYLSRGHDPFTAAEDSGAIIVGSAKSIWTPTPRAWNDGSSTYGSTVDLQGWGMHILAPGYGNYYNDEGDSLNYTLFSGTSGASPMVTAAAAIVQANYIAKNGTASTPATVKSLLINTGTPQANEGAEHIGPFPDLRGAINSIWNLPEPVAPTITPGSGDFNMPLQVTIGYGDGSQNSTNTHIRYTLNGSEPTFDSFIYIPELGDKIHLLYGATVRAKAFSGNSFADRFIESETATAIYTSTTPKVATPTISPNGGTYNQGTSIIMSTSTPGATIRYRTDGRAPSFFYPGTEYTGPLNLAPGTYEIVARAYKDGYYKSDTAYAGDITITPITLPSPVVYPDGGTFAGEVTVYLGSTVLGAQIRYTLDGSTPTESSALFTEPLALTSSTTVKARIYLDGYSPSNVVTKLFTIVGEANAPTFSPPSGTTANNNLQVTLSTTTANATIRYTTNGAEPTSYSTAYTGPFNLGIGQHTVKAKAFLPGANASSTSTAAYTVFNTSINIATPKIDPIGGNFNGPVLVTITTDTANVSQIKYTLDASDPNTSGTAQVYSGPFLLNASPTTYFVRARAYKSGANSGMASATIVVVNPVNGPIQTPTISPPGGVFTNSVSVKVQAPDFSTPFNVRRLYVTKDGTEPVANFSTSGNGTGGTYNFSVFSPQTVKALSAQAGWFDSGIAEAEFTFVCDTPTITEGGTFESSKNVSISSGTTSASIYYTTDGSEPTTSDTKYSSSFNVTSDTVVKAMCTKNNYEDSETAVSVFLITPPPTAPAITTQPTNQSVNTCGTTEFNVVATGSDPLTYTWFKDGNIIGGEDEPTLTLTAVSNNDAGSYHVIVENSEGSVQSNTAVLSILTTNATCSVAIEYKLYLPIIIR
ncbi:MAG: hypothetical protein DWQ04_09225 [Chloroflexi bacterium]|nr:MAG: hypothetical protein DWQ04_09225 [Chloroflexota bacterium]